MLSSRPIHASGFLAKEVIGLKWKKLHWRLGFQHVNLEKILFSPEQSASKWGLGSYSNSFQQSEWNLKVDSPSEAQTTTQYD